MVTLATLVSRVEALVVASMLKAAGVQVHVGGAAHSSVAVNSLALGGHRLWVPAGQWRYATDLLLEVLGEEEWGFSPGLQRAVWRFLGLWVGLNAIILAPLLLFAEVPAITLLTAPLAVLVVPVNPQGRGDYYLAEDEPGDD